MNKAFLIIGLVVLAAAGLLVFVMSDKQDTGQAVVEEQPAVEETVVDEPTGTEEAAAEDTAGKGVAKQLAATDMFAGRVENAIYQSSMPNSGSRR